MLHKKTIFETIAVLGTGAMLLSGCGGSQSPVNSTEVPTAGVPAGAPREALSPATGEGKDPPAALATPDSAAKAATPEAAAPAGNAMAASSAAPAASAAASAKAP